MKKFVLLLLSTISLKLIFSQDVLTFGGAYFTNPSGSFSITIGEVIGETFNSNNFFLTQGFQQSELSNSQLTFIEKDFLKMYPNPARDFIQIESNEALSGELIFLNLAGSEVLKKEINGSHSSNIAIKDLKQAPYLIYFRDRSNQTYFLGNLIKIDL